MRGVIAKSRETIKEDGYDELLWDEGLSFSLLLFLRRAELTFPLLSLFSPTTSPPLTTTTNEPGDGIVLHSSASALPGGPERWTRHLKGEVESNYGHVSLVGDVDGIKKCLVKLYDE